MTRIGTTTRSQRVRSTSVPIFSQVGQGFGRVCVCGGALVRDWLPRRRGTWLGGGGLGHQGWWDLATRETFNIFPTVDMKVDLGRVLHTTVNFDPCTLDSTEKQNKRTLARKASANTHSVFMTAVMSAKVDVDIHEQADQCFARSRVVTDETGSLQQQQQCSTLLLI